MFSWNKNIKIQKTNMMSTYMRFIRVENFNDVDANVSKAYQRNKLVCSKLKHKDLKTKPTKVSTNLGKLTQ